MWLKRLLRPLIPDRIMARYRLRQHSRQVRTNVDLLVPGRRRQRRWLAVTPDTYRVGDPPAERATVPDSSVVVGDPTHAGLAAAALEATGADAAVVGLVGRPRLVARRRTEPAVEPLTVLAAAGLVEEVGGAPAGDPAGLVRRLRDAGARLAVVSAGTADSPRTGRFDPITAPVVVLLAAVPMHDVGGGSRTTQLALELLHRDVAVVYVAAFGSQEGDDLGLRFVHHRLEQYRLDELDAAVLAARADPGWVLAAVPLPAFSDPIDTLQSHGWKVGFDVIDRWSDPALGGEWYDAGFERALLAGSDAVTVSAADLVAVAEAAGRGDAVVVPNAVNAAVFGAPPGSPPDDLPAGDGPILGYHGSLYGDWIDWEAIGRLAEARSDARVVIIGDASKGHPPLPGNVHLLGLKPMQALPDYVRRFDVGLVPFVVSATTHAVSPLKVYEYLACGVPVAAPPLRSLAGLDGVTADDDLVAAVAAALAAPRPDATSAVAEHSWGRRVEQFLDVFGIPASHGEPALVAMRPVIHYERTARRLPER